MQYLKKKPTPTPLTIRKDSQQTTSSPKLRVVELKSTFASVGFKSTSLVSSSLQRSGLKFQWLTASLPSVSAKLNSLLWLPMPVFFMCFLLLLFFC